ncbi:DUF2076 domain-containing protein [Rhizobium sp. SAFR-030]|uniref:DUF2076 domain-containing protein n=1 Tax=Rhizobium sp. SAFR-030 TaxID=3387277 RepID=UPI003F8097AE
MSPEERQLLTDLFGRIQSAANTPRDPDAERLIADAVRSEPASPYYLAQAVIVQEKGLEAAAARISELEGRIRDLEAGATASTGERGGFLSSIFGSSQPPRSSTTPQTRPVNAGPSAGGPWSASAAASNPAQPAASQPTYPQQAYAPPAQPQASGPWSPQMRSPSSGGSFLTGALGTAAGVAGGMLLANSLSGIFGQHMAGLGLGSPQSEGFGSAPVEETVINNYYGDAPDAGTAPDADPDVSREDTYLQNASDEAGGDSWTDDAGDSDGSDDSSFA